jgi:adenine-specific DNA-methyltransferase
MPELIWDGKYDKDGKQVPPLRVPLPFQTTETVNESVQERQRTFDLFGRGQASEWRNRLIWGDRRYVLPALVEEFSGAVDLIYIDPPFATGADFSLPMEIEGIGFTKQPSIIEQKAYRDTWGVTNEEKRRGITYVDRYVRWIYETVSVLRELLSRRGTIYVHVGPNLDHVVRSVLDEVFGWDNFRGEIIWKRTSAHSDSGQGARRFGRVHDCILVYTTTDEFIWHPPHGEHDDKYISSHYSLQDPETGRRYRLDNLTGPGGAARGNPSYEVMGITRHWRYSKERMNELIAEGRIVQSRPGAVPSYKRYLDESVGPGLGTIWTDIPPVNSQALEDTGYPTQKPRPLLERILGTSSDAGSMVLDCFCGSGTTPLVAEMSDRRWIAADLSRFAIHTTRKRLLSVPGVKPFVIQNLGKYERQIWQTAEFGQIAAIRTHAYREFILQLFKARPVEGYAWLHGIKHGRMVHVGTVDSPVTTGDIKQIASEFRRVMGTGKDAPTARSVDVLGWDFAFELNEVAKQEAARAGIEMRFVRIPREVLDKRAVDQGDIRFFELAALSIDLANKKRSATIALTNFVIPLDDVPEDVQKAISSWHQWIDYWAIDWDNKDDTFHNEWQSYRTKGKRDIEILATHLYEQSGQYRVVVKVIDILGNDTTKTILVDIP